TALAINQGLVQEDPRNPSFVQNLASAYEGLARLQLTQQRMAEAEVAVQDGVKILKPLARDNPAVSRYQDYLATLDRLVVRVETRTCQASKAAAAQEKAVAIAESLAANNPNVVAYQEQLASSYVSLGEFYKGPDQLARAEEIYR